MRADFLADGTDHGTREVREAVKGELKQILESASRLPLTTHSDEPQGRDDLPSVAIKCFESSKTSIYAWCVRTKSMVVCFAA